jgi:putative tryptophan/tyrosine transport system substrate-binding protein
MRLGATDMKRTRFFWLLAALLLTPVSSAQAQSKVARVGILIAGTPVTMKSRVDALRQGMKELGWVDGDNVAFEYRYAGGKLEALEKSAAELVNLKVDLIVAASLGVQAAKKATSVIPIVMMGYGDDPVQTKLVASLAKPGGNVTGVINEDLVGKRLEIFKEALPKISQVTVFWNPTADVEDLKQLQSLAPSLKLKIGSLKIANHADIDRAFASTTKNRPDALFVLGSPVVNSARQKIIKRATDDKLPIMGPDTRWTDDGALLAYSHDAEDQARRAAV